MLFEQEFNSTERVTKQCPKDLYHEEANRTEKLALIPQTLIIRYKRTGWDKSGHLIKRNNHIPTEETINLWDFCHRDLKDLYQDNKASAQYDLVGIIRHFGQDNGKCL